MDRAGQRPGLGTEYDPAGAAPARGGRRRGGVQRVQLHAAATHVVAGNAPGTPDQSSGSRRRVERGEPDTLDDAALRTDRHEPAAMVCISAADREGGLAVALQRADALVWRRVL